MFRYSIPSSDNDYLYSVGLPGTSGSQMTLSRRSGSRAYHYDGSITNAPANTDIPEDEWLVFTQTFGDGGPANHVLRDSGRPIMETSANNDYAVDAGEFVIGNWSSGRSFFVGDLVELLVYDRVLSGSDRPQAEAYLRSRAGCVVDMSLASIITTTRGIEVITK